MCADVTCEARQSCIDGVCEPLTGDAAAGETCLLPRKRPECYRVTLYDNLTRNMSFNGRPIEGGH